MGIKGDADGVKVYFPIGYQLSEGDVEIRKDITNLIQILLEFTESKERVLEIDKLGGIKKVDFPINSYLEIIKSFLQSNGKYYLEKEISYETRTKGKIAWSRTFSKQTPLIQIKNGINSLIYTKFTVQSDSLNEKKLITQIHKYCVYESFKKLGWMYVSTIPDKPDLYPDIKTAIIIINDKLSRTFNDKEKLLFRAMKNMLEYMDNRSSEKQFYFGTYHFEFVWERLIDCIFGEKNKREYFPRGHWNMKYGEVKNKDTVPLEPDSIMIHNNKYYILDAKYYRYGISGDVKHLPNMSSINKQITYAEYVKQLKQVPNKSLYNAFIMPYNMNKNLLGLKNVAENIGEAISDTRQNNMRYEHIQGIVVDIRYLMYNYIGNITKCRDILSESIENVFDK